MRMKLPEFLSASAVVWAVAVFPYAIFWLPFQVGLWAGGSVLVAIVAVLIALGRRDLVTAFTTCLLYTSPSPRDCS